MNNIDTIVEQALRDAVAGAGQSEATANRILSWMDELSGGGSDIEDKSEVSQRIGLILSSIQTDESSQNDH